MEYHYLKLANELEQKIRAGSYRAGEKLPSLRSMREQTGRSITTVSQAYAELEQRGVVDVREKSGFYVKPLLDRNFPLPVSGSKIIRPHKVTINAMATILQQAISNPAVLPFGSALPGPDLLPTRQLTREIRKSLAQYASDDLVGYCDPTGFQGLRTEIEKRMVGWFNPGNGDEVVITGGCLAAIDLCLRSVAKAGDTILVESPTFLCYLQLIEDLNMQALEIPVDPATGIDLVLLQKALGEHDVQAALLNANFHNPLGYVMDADAKQALVEIFAKMNIPIIEDDIYGDLYFDEKRPLPLKAFDSEGLVLYCSSFTKTLAPDLRIGWTVPGRYRERVKRVKFNSSVANSRLLQRGVATFLAGGAHERHLRKMRGALKKQLAAFLLAIATYFPAGTRVSAPRGGLCLWVELDRTVDAMELFDRARQEDIVIVPGSLCSASESYNHCLRLNFGYPWTAKCEAGMCILGNIIKEMISENESSESVVISGTDLP